MGKRGRPPGSVSGAGGRAYLQMWEKRFSKEYTLRPIFFEMALQLLPWRLCSFTRECSSASENLQTGSRKKLVDG